MPDASEHQAGHAEGLCLQLPGRQKASTLWPAHDREGTLWDAPLYLSFDRGQQQEPHSGLEFSHLKRPKSPFVGGFRFPARKAESAGSKSRDPKLGARDEHRAQGSQGLVSRPGGNETAEKTWGKCAT